MKKEVASVQNLEFMHEWSEFSERHDYVGIQYRTRKEIIMFCNLQIHISLLRDRLCKIRGLS